MPSTSTIFAGRFRSVSSVRACAEKLNFLSPFSLARKPSTIVDWHRDWKAAQEALKKRGAAINPAVSAAIAEAFVFIMISSSLVAVVAFYLIPSKSRFYNTRRTEEGNSS